MSWDERDLRGTACNENILRLGTMSLVVRGEGSLYWDKEVLIVLQYRGRTSRCDLVRCCEKSRDESTLCLVLDASPTTRLDYQLTNRAA